MLPCSVAPGQALKKMFGLRQPNPARLVKMCHSGIYFSYFTDDANLTHVHIRRLFIVLTKKSINVLVTPKQDISFWAKKLRI